jgi:hypothetical protein
MPAPATPRGLAGSAMRLPRSSGETVGMKSITEK